MRFGEWTGAWVTRWSSAVDLSLENHDLIAGSVEVYRDEKAVLRVGADHDVRAGVVHGAGELEDPHGSRRPHGEDGDRRAGFDLDLGVHHELRFIEMKDAPAHEVDAVINGDVHALAVALLLLLDVAADALRGTPPALGFRRLSRPRPRQCHLPPQRPPKNNDRVPESNGRIG